MSDFESTEMSTRESGRGNKVNPQETGLRECKETADTNAFLPCSI